jgi:hypothetical protein
MQITTLEEAERFDAHLAAYETKVAATALPYLPVGLAFRKFPPTDGDGRLFYALLDLKISVVLLSNDMFSAGCAWNDAYQTSEARSRKALDSPEAFAAKMAFHESLNSFVLRYRAVWDKIFSAMVLLHAPEQYQAFRNQKKGRRKTFLKILGDHPDLNRRALEHIVSDLDRFETMFRTPEIHDTGSIRKWSFTIAEFSGSPHEMLVGYWNNLVYTLHSLTEKIKTA